MAIYTLRTTSGREDIVADMMLSKIRAEKLNVKAIVHPAELKGYIFIEGGLADIHKAIHGMLHIRGLIEKPVDMEEIQHFFDTKKARIVVGQEDVVEIIGGPFKGERGKIQRIDKAKDEVTVELLEASVPIPITIATEFVKLVKKSKARKEREAREEEEKNERVGLPGAEEIRRGITEEKPPEEEKKEEPSILEEATREKEEAKPEEERPEAPEEEKRPPKKMVKPEPVIMESEEEIGAPVIPREEEKPEEGEQAPEKDSLLTELEKEKEKKKKSPEDLEEGE